MMSNPQNCSLYSAFLRVTQKCHVLAFIFYHDFGSVTIPPWIIALRSIILTLTCP